MFKQLIAALVIALCATVSMSVHADGYPDRPVRIIHGFGAGGNADTVARIIAEPLTERLGQPFVVEPKPGAGGNVASDFVAHAKPDGNVLQLMVGGHSVSGALYRSLAFDAVDDFTFISRITSFPFFIATRSGAYADIEALIAAGQEGGRLKFGSAGVGTTQHLTGELLALKTGAKFLHIPYKGDNGSMTALLGGEVDFIVAVGASVLSQASSGELDLLAVSWDRPWPETPDVPTLGSTVAPGFNVFSWLGLGAPKGLPDEISGTLNAAMVDILQDEEVQSRIRSFGAVAGSSSSEEMREMIVSQISEWNAAIDAAGIARK
jgi:tripartite-type tricarboxylate transporter receptor subunit TctC